MMIETDLFLGFVDDVGDELGDEPEELGEELEVVEDESDGESLPPLMLSKSSSAFC